MKSVVRIGILDTSYYYTILEIREREREREMYAVCKNGERVRMVWCSRYIILLYYYGNSLFLFLSLFYIYIYIYIYIYRRESKNGMVFSIHYTIILLWKFSIVCCPFHLSHATWIDDSAEFESCLVYMSHVSGYMTHVSYTTGWRRFIGFVII